MKYTKNTILVIAAFFAIYVIWGSTYLFNKVLVTELPPLYLAGIRFFTAGVLMLVISILSGASLSLSKKQLKNTILAGFFFLVYGNGVFVWALKYVDSGFGALIASTQPLFVLLLMRLIDGKKLQKRSMMGIALGGIGMFLLVSQKGISTSEETLLGIFMILTCVLSWSYGSVFVSNAELHKNYVISTGYQMLFSGIILCIGSLFLDEPWTLPDTWSAKAQLSMTFLIFFGSIIAFTSFNFLLKVVATDKVATSAYINPVIALFFGWLFLDEVLSLQSIIASIILLTGVYFITKRKRGISKRIG